MNLFLTIVLFVAVLLFYLNWTEECKIGKDLEIYEMDYLNNNHLQDICKSKQPILFSLNLADSHHLRTTQLTDLAEKYGKEYVHVSSPKTPIPLEYAVQLKDGVVCEDNHDFIMDTPLHHYYASVDEYLKPSGTLQTIYDMVFGQATPLRFHRNRSMFVYAAQGELNIKLSPMKNIPVGKMGTDGYVYPLGEWVEEDISFLYMTVPEDGCVFIPPYWWFSIEFQSSSTEEIPWMATFTYNTFMNRFVVMPLEWLERFQTKRKQIHLEEEEEEEVEKETKEEVEEEERSGPVLSKDS